MSEMAVACLQMGGACRSLSSCMHTGKCIRQTEAEASRLITHKDVVGQIAMWAVRQHPYGRPHGLFELCEAVSEASKVWPDGVDSLRMWRVGGWLELELWLRPIFYAHWVPAEWNKPRSGHTESFVTSSRYWGPKPEDDFVDIDALLRSVAMGVWKEAREDR